MQQIKRKLNSWKWKSSRNLERKNLEEQEIQLSHVMSKTKIEKNCSQTKRFEQDLSITLYGRRHNTDLLLRLGLLPSVFYHY